MYRVQTLNKISAAGLEALPREGFEIASEIANPDALILRSFSLHGKEIAKGVKAIARAGAGYNNIPVEECSARGIVVFNTPGANANGVKELVILGLLVSSRKVSEGISWTQSLKGKGDEVVSLIEEKKSSFAGPEIAGKKLGVLGLGAIGVLTANAAAALGMKVTGYDPYISVESAWNLSKDVSRAISLDSLLMDCDYLTLHIPLDNSTRGLLSKEKLSLMKQGVRIVNCARVGLVNNEDLISALVAGKVAAYVTDFPEDELLGVPGIIPVPHLGASTPESEENCAYMAAKQVRDFLAEGIIKNSVNFPECVMDKTSGHRLTVANRNIPTMVSRITAVLGGAGINITDMLNKHRGDIAYNIIDAEGEFTENLITELERIEGVLMVRYLG